MRKVVIASHNPVKIAAVREACTRMFPGKEFFFEGAAISSGVADQPRSSDETRRGALNRAAGAAVASPSAHLHVGIEGGIEETAVGMEAFAWVAVSASDGKVGTARSAAFLLPPAVAALIREGKELGDADDIVFGRVNSKQDNGAIGILTGNAIERRDYYRDAVIMALIPFKNPDLYI